jgi:hypothetical protein
MDLHKLIFVPMPAQVPAMNGGKVTEAEAQQFIAAANASPQLLSNLLVQNQSVSADMLNVLLSRCTKSVQFRAG